MIVYTNYRVLLILPRLRQIIALRTVEGLDLPVVCISSTERSAEQLTRLVEAKWGIKSIVLRNLSDGALPSRCALIEVRSDPWDYAADGFTDVSLENIDARLLGEGERKALCAILAEHNLSKSPFSQIGWLEEIQDWIRGAVTDRDVSFSGEIRHITAGDDSCVVRLGTTHGPAYWVKAVGDYNAREYDLTAYLAKNSPTYLPRVVTMRPEWRAWVTEEMGSTLLEATSVDDFICATLSLGSLQRDLVRNTEQLLALQCCDHRLDALSTHIDEMIAFFAEIMELQTSTKVPRLSAARLNELGGVLHGTCDVMHGLSIPNSLMHNDLNLGNILRIDDRCVFIDWCGANVGNPFVTFQQLCVYITRDVDNSDSWIKSLKPAYKACWLEALTENTIDKAFRLAPLISLLCAFYDRGDWLRTPARNDSQRQSHARSLARHMNRAAFAPALLEAL
jgi:Phosphotransferase enzyme family